MGALFSLRIHPPILAPPVIRGRIRRLGTSFLKGTHLSIKVKLNAIYSYLSPERLCTSLRLLHTLWFTLYHGSLEKKNESVEDSGRKELRQEWKAVRLPPNVALECALVCWTMLENLRYENC